MLLLLSARLWQQDWCAAEKALCTQLNGRIRPLSLDSSHLIIEWNHTMPFISGYSLNTQVFVWLNGFFWIHYILNTIWTVCYWCFWLFYVCLNVYPVDLRHKNTSYCFLYECRMINIAARSWKPGKKSGNFLIVWESNKTSKVREMFLYFDSQNVKSSFSSIQIFLEYHTII